MCVHDVRFTFRPCRLRLSLRSYECALDILATACIATTWQFRTIATSVAVAVAAVAAVAAAAMDSPST